MATAIEAPLEDAPSQPDPNIIPFDSAFLDSLDGKLGLPPEEQAPADDAPPVAPPTEAAPPAKPDRPEARKRIEEKELRTRLSEYEKELEELRPLRTKATELETTLTETRTLAEQRAAEKKLLEDAYRNETEILPETVINELPEVREAMESYNKAERSLFPATLNDPNSGEPLKRFDPSKLNSEGPKIGALIQLWEQEEFEGKGTPEYRADVQHVIVSQIAQILGTSKDNYVQKTVGGQSYDVIPTTHPVYTHIATNLLPYIEARNAAREVREKAAGKAAETIGGVVTQRVANSRKMFADLGVTKQGEELKAALAQAPDNLTLKALSLLHGHEDLAAELRDNTEMELAVQGHLRPNLDLAETDPKLRTEKANAMKARVGLRAAYAPLVIPLKKLAVRQQAEITELKAKLAAAEAEASKTRQQAEPGSVVSRDEGGAPATPDESFYGSISSKLGI